MNILRRLFKWLLYIIAAFFIISILQVIVFKWAPVPRTPLMMMRSRENRHNDKWKLQYQWMPVSSISSQMLHAVVTSEDSRFEKHRGFDWIEINNALNNEKRKKKRGASTISQQTAKNVFLWPGRSFIRKGLEAYYTILIETIWGKERILEVYLNVAEMGNGIFGAEAAARYYYKKPASKLTSSEAAMIAAILPNPIKRNPKEPTSYLLKRRQTILNLMKKTPKPKFE